MTGMAGRRAINLKVLASVKSLGKTAALKCEKEVTLKAFFDAIGSLTRSV